MTYENYDFSGWATRNGVLCSDGRTILKDAFKDCDGMSVPLVWNHQHDSPENVLGHGILQNRPEGVRVYGYFNDTEMGQVAREHVKHKDIKNLSIFANKLKQTNGFVSHGIIREVSLVLAGANPGAVIDFVLAHSEDAEEAAIIYTDEEIEFDTVESIEHSDKEEKGEEMDKEKEKNEEKEPEKKDPTGNEVFETLNEDQKKLVYALVGAALEESAAKDSTGNEVFETLNEDQKKLVYALVSAALEESAAKDSKEEGEKEMKHNVFSKDNNDAMVASLRKEFEAAVIKDAKQFGSMRDSFLAHSEEFEEYLAHAVPTEGMDTEGKINREDDNGPYGIGNIDFLFPEARALANEPEFIRRNDDWVQKVMNAVHKSPFSRIKSLFADITEDEARAKGYMTGNMKKNEVFTLLRRPTDPVTIYKKQKLDRDDMIDITDFNVVNFLKKEMRIMLNEELAGAILFGDGRDPSSEDHIPTDHIRPIAFEAPLFNVKVDSGIDISQLGEDEVASETAAKAFVRAAIRARKQYRGSGNPTLFIGENLLTEILLLEDGFGHMKYANIGALATVLRVKEIVSISLMDERNIKDPEGKSVMAVIVNLNDYTVGADKGGEVNMFDDFDIDYNQMKYLIETRCSGALTKPYSAITVFSAAQA